MTSQVPANSGRPIAAAAVVGSSAFALFLVIQVAGLLGSIESGLAGGYAARGFGLSADAVQPWWDFCVCGLLVYAVVWLLFETPGTGRRVMLLLTVLVLVLALSPVLALWDVFWSPYAAGLAVMWGGGSAILWARQQRMPCELPVVEEVRGGKIIPIKSEEVRREPVVDQSERKPAARGGNKRRRRRK